MCSCQLWKIKDMKIQNVSCQLWKIKDMKIQNVFLPVIEQKGYEHLECVLASYGK